MSNKHSFIYNINRTIAVFWSCLLVFHTRIRRWGRTKPSNTWNRNAEVTFVWLRTEHYVPNESGLSMSLTLHRDFNSENLVCFPVDSLLTESHREIHGNPLSTRVFLQAGLTTKWKSEVWRCSYLSFVLFLKWSRMWQILWFSTAVIGAQSCGRFCVSCAPVVSWLWGLRFSDGNFGSF